MEDWNAPTCHRMVECGPYGASTLIAPFTLSRNRGQKKARLGSRADKGLEIFFVNEKVCFEKQNFQYSRLIAI
ncbi:hypothetical protein VOM14_06155 [Paraburkholderia sp. MPAMCS5]|uniref:hypothetical protein n=1 Tax=Paraburkholderia sp. MPAMCS5 TaxID=3112563 RepID=UPI002E189A47|nr:hypothetical protein [Paraburkholderia sp. MPAMCS5]